MTLFTTYFAREGMNLQYPCSAAPVKYYNAKERLQANKLAAHKPSLPPPLYTRCFLHRPRNNFVLTRTSFVCSVAWSIMCNILDCIFTE